jgi:hypothetical protein
MAVVFGAEGFLVSYCYWLASAPLIMPGKEVGSSAKEIN